MTFKRLGGAVIPFHRTKRTADLYKPAVAEDAPSDRKGATNGRSSNTPSGRLISAGQSGAESKSNLRAKTQAPEIPPHGPRTPLIHLRPQPSPQIILLALFVAIGIVWLAIVAAIAAWSHPQ